jgi:hypothetical protein
MSGFDTKQAWEAAFGAAYRRASSELGMDHDESEAYAKKHTGPWDPLARLPVVPATVALKVLTAPPPAGLDKGATRNVPAQPQRAVLPRPIDSATVSAKATPAEAVARPALTDAPSPMDKCNLVPSEPTKYPARISSAAARQAAGPVVSPTRQSSFWVAAAGVFITALYCIAELCYNMSLVEFVSSANTSADAFENLERVGKLLGAIGLTLALAKTFLKGWRAAAAIAIMAPLAYLGIDRGFDAYIGGLPHEAKVEGYYLGAYRSLLLSGKLQDPDFGGLDASIERKVRLLSLPLAIGSGKDPQAKVSNYVFGSDGPSGFDKEISGLWDIYDSVSRRVDPLYGYYAIESRKAESHQAFRDKYVAGFLKKSGGIPPGLSKAQFNAAIQSAYPSLARYRATVAIPAQPAINLPALTMGDIPPGLDQPGFSSFFRAHIARARAARLAASDQVETLPSSTNIIASAVVPPLSMSLSLLSFGLNLASAGAGLTLLALWPMRKSRAWPLFGLAVKAGLTIVVLAWMLSAPPALSGVAGQWQARAASASTAGAAWSRAINAESSLISAARPVLPAIHKLFIDDSHPDQVKRVTVEKAREIDMGDLDQKLAEFKTAAQTDDGPQVPDRGFYADEKRLDDKGYYGETRPSGGNPYQKK